VAVLAMSLLSAAAPQPARADLKDIAGDALGCATNPIGCVAGPAADAAGDLVGGAADAAGDLVGGAIDKMAVEAFSAILDKLFGDLPAQLTSGVMAGLLKLPDLSEGGNILQLAQMVQMISLGLLTAVLTVTFLRFMFVGMGPGGSGYEPLQAFLRVGVATTAVLLWPAMFTIVIGLEQTVIDVLWKNHVVQGDLAQLYEISFAFGVAGGGFAWFIGILVAIAIATLLILLVLVKIVITASTVFLFVAMPLAFMVWPIPELGWLTRAAAKTLTVLMLIPVLWTVLFAACAAMGVDVLSFQGGGTLIDKALVKPLVLVALLYVAFVLPKHLIRMAAMGAPTPGGGFISRTGSYMVGRQAGQALQPYIPQWAGGTAQTGGPDLSATAFRRQDGIREEARFTGPDAGGRAAQWRTEAGWEPDDETGGGKSNDRRSGGASENGSASRDHARGGSASGAGTASGSNGATSGNGTQGGRARPQSATRAATDPLLPERPFDAAGVQREYEQMARMAGTAGASRQAAQQAMGGLTPRMREQIAEKAAAAKTDAGFARSMGREALNLGYTQVEADAFRVIGAHAVTHGKAAVADLASMPVSDTAASTTPPGNAPMTDIRFWAPESGPASTSEPGTQSSSSGGQAAGGGRQTRPIPDPPPGYQPPPADHSKHAPSDDPKARPERPFRQP
jgi:uncharacterized membrane protein YgcG